MQMALIARNVAATVGALLKVSVSLATYLWLFLCCCAKLARLVSISVQKYALL